MARNCRSERDGAGGRGRKVITIARGRFIDAAQAIHERIAAGDLGAITRKAGLRQRGCRRGVSRSEVTAAAR